MPDDLADLDALRAASEGCRGCPLYERATQTVFGDGNPRAPVMLVGEQPGDQEDRAGLPFVGPAGRLLRDAMEQAGIAEDSAYLTNAVKHFKWEPRGKVRLHKKPSVAEVRACSPWLAAEIEAVRPHVVVTLGATAGQALLGPNVRVTKERGVPRVGPAGSTLVPTVHPSSILRAQDRDDRAAQRALFVNELRAVAAMLER